MPTLQRAKSAPRGRHRRSYSDPRIPSILNSHRKGSRAEWVSVGHFVEIEKGRHRGQVAVIRYVGAVQFAKSHWVGVELQKPTGQHDGSVQGVRYFHCLPKHGIFVKAAVLAPASEPPGSSGGSGAGDHSRRGRPRTQPDTIPEHEELHDAPAESKLGDDSAFMRNKPILHRAFTTRPSSGQRKPRKTVSSVKARLRKIISKNPSRKRQAHDRTGLVAQRKAKDRLQAMAVRQASVTSLPVTNDEREQALRTPPSPLSPVSFSDVGHPALVNALSVGTSPLTISPSPSPSSSTGASPARPLGRPKSARRPAGRSLADARSAVVGAAGKIKKPGADPGPQKGKLRRRVRSARRAGDGQKVGKIKTAVKRPGSSRKRRGRRARPAAAGADDAVGDKVARPSSTVVVSAPDETGHPRARAHKQHAGGKDRVDELQRRARRKPPVEDRASAPPRHEEKEEEEDDVGHADANMLARAAAAPVPRRPARRRKPQDVKSDDVEDEEEEVEAAKVPQGAAKANPPVAGGDEDEEDEAAKELARATARAEQLRLAIEAEERRQRELEQKLAALTPGGPEVERIKPGDSVNGKKHVTPGGPISASKNKAEPKKGVHPPNASALDDPDRMSFKDLLQTRGGPSEDEKSVQDSFHSDDDEIAYVPDSGDDSDHLTDFGSESDMVPEPDIVPDSPKPPIESILRVNSLNRWGDANEHDVSNANAYTPGKPEPPKAMNYPGQMQSQDRYDDLSDSLDDVDYDNYDEAYAEDDDEEEEEAKAGDDASGAKKRKNRRRQKKKRYRKTWNEKKAGSMVEADPVVAPPRRVQSFTSEQKKHEISVTQLELQKSIARLKSTYDNKGNTRDFPRGRRTSVPDLLLQPDHSGSLPLDLGIEEQHRAKKKASKRKRLREELVQSEVSYVKYLHSTLALIVRPLQTEKLQAKIGVSSKDVTRLFSNLEVIANFHQVLLMDLQSEPSLGEVFQKNTPYLEQMYGEYINSYDLCIGTLGRLRKNSKFQAFLDEQQKKPDLGGLSLLSLLVMPIQRIPRYELLLTQIRLLTDDELPEALELDEAVSLLQATSQQSAAITVPPSSALGNLQGVSASSKAGKAQSRSDAILQHGVQKRRRSIPRNELPRANSLKHGLLISEYIALPDVKSFMLHVQVVEAKSLTAADMNGLSDPYVVAKISTGHAPSTQQRKKKKRVYEEKTEVIKETLNPVWNAEYTFIMYDMEGVAEFLVYDKDRLFRDDFLGKVEVPMSSFATSNEVIGWFPLHDKRMKKKTKGDLHLKLVVDRDRTQERSKDQLAFVHHRKSLFHEMSQVYDQERKHQNLSEVVQMTVGTWNVGNKPPGPLADWLDTQSDIIAVGVQECQYDVKKGTCGKHWQQHIERALGNGFTCVGSHKLMQMRLHIFASTSVAPLISDVEVSQEATGVGSVVGNKGAVAVAMKIRDTSVCFVCCHLAAHQHKAKERNADVKEIIHGLSLGAYPGVDVLHQFDHVVFLGDLNYRLDYGDQGNDMSPSQSTFDEMVSLIEAGFYSHLAGSDQLQREMRSKRLLIGFQEGPLEFAPTFKFKNGRAREYNPKRSPAWCDRILWKSSPDHPMEQLSYGCTANVVSSDHAPVSAVFSLPVVELPPGIDASLGPCAIHFTELSGENLIAADLNGLSDPYVIFKASFLDRTYKTPVRPRTLSPVWSHADLPILESNVNSKDRLALCSIILHVMDRDVGTTDDDIGFGTLALGPYLSSDEDAASNTSAAAANGLTSSSSSSSLLSPRSGGGVVNKPFTVPLLLGGLPAGCLKGRIVIEWGVHEFQPNLMRTSTEVATLLAQQEQNDDAPSVSAASGGLNKNKNIGQARRSGLRQPKSYDS